jgi:class 3 adenylate cyclase
MSLAILQCKQQVRVPRTSAELQLRIGIHTGSYFCMKSIK